MTTHLPYSALIVNQPPHYVYSDVVCEKKQAYHILTERHLQAMWLEQKYFRTLQINGIPIEILSPGIWNSEAGPDFLKAHLRIGGQEWRGDIELHLSQEGWYQHGHHEDPNYNHVILHVCYWQSLKERLIYTCEGKRIPTAYLQDALTVPESRIIKLIDLDLYPYKHFAGSGKCSHALFNHLTKEKTHALLRSAAIWRLKEKKERFEAKIENPAHHLIGGIAMVLGYKHNAEAFLTIFNALIKKKREDERILLAQALAMGGFFSPHFQEKWKGSSDYQNLKSVSTTLEISSSLPLNLDKIRPANHPVRRLAILVKLLCDPKMSRFEADLISVWSNFWKTSSPEWKKVKHHLLALIPTYSDSYWESHYTFEVDAQQKAISLMGADLKQEILINVCLPLLHGNIESREDPEEIEAFLTFYASIPATKTTKSSYLDYRFFGRQHQNPSFLKADLQQGAYQIHRDFCVHFEASCQRCPFIERYTQAVR